MSATERKALEWQAAHMKPGDWVGDCHYVKSGFAVWFQGEYAGACTCKAVPKSYAPFLPKGDA